MNVKPFEIQSTITSSLVRHFVLIIGVLLLLLFFVQFIGLTLLGTKGAEIAQFRSAKDQFRIENEYLRSEIDRAKTLLEIEGGLNEIYELETKSVEQIYDYSKGDDRLSVLVP